MNNYMKIAFVGIGSIAKRHIRNLAVILKKRNIKYVIDIVRSGKGNFLDDDLLSLIHRCFVVGEEMERDYDVFFITNPTSLHYSTIQRYIDCTKHMFIEKPVFSSWEYDIKRWDLNKENIYYVACPLRYTATLRYVFEKIDYRKAISVRSICSSYLPNWRPGTDYRNSYSAQKCLGGGVAIDLVHEWDYLTFLFGFPNCVKSIIGKKSHLEIDSDDIAIYLGEYDNKTIELHLDYFGYKNIREMQLFMPDDVITVDIQNNRIAFARTDTEVLLHEERDEYQIKELEFFLDMIEGKVENTNTIENALAVLRIAEGEW